MTETKHEELDKVQPSEFYLTILKKKRRVMFGNRAIAELERRYESLSNLNEFQKEFAEKPFQTMPWILRISMTDQEGLGETDDDLLNALDESNIPPKEVISVIMKAMNSSLSNIGEEKKTTPTKKKK